MGVGALIQEPRPMSLDLQKAENEGFPMRYITFSVAQVALEITDIKVEQSKKRPNLLSKSQKKLKLKL